MFKMFSMMILSGLATIPAAYGQSTQPIQAKVPFTFTVHDTTLPAGDYRLTYSDTASILTIRGAQGTPGGAFVRALPQSAPGASEQSAKLVFQCHDKSCYLAQVWQGSISGDRSLEVPEPAHERRLAFETRVVSITLAAK
jgi:hypothetical protein